jgi:hypothetical protein
VLAERRARRPELEGEGMTGRELARLQPPPLRTVAPQVGAELAAIVDMATAPDRRDRYPTAERMLEDLQRFLAGEPVEAMFGHPLYRFGKAVRKHLAVIITAAAVTFAPLAWFYLRYDADQQVAERSEAIARLLDELVPQRVSGLVDRQKNELVLAHQELAEAYSWVGEWQKAEENRAAAARLSSPLYQEELAFPTTRPESDHGSVGGPAPSGEPKP